MNFPSHIKPADYLKYEVFVNFDTDKSGKVSINELNEALDKIDLGDDAPDEEQMKQYLAETSMDQNGEIEFEEFKVLIDKIFPKMFI